MIPAKRRWILLALFVLTAATPLRAQAQVDYWKDQGDRLLGGKTVQSRSFTTSSSLASDGVPPNGQGMNGAPASNGTLERQALLDTNYQLYGLIVLAFVVTFGLTVLYRRQRYA